MRLLALALSVLSAQGIAAWDIRDWSDKWWRQDTTPTEHKHHKHYRHHHHRAQLCEPIITTSLKLATTTTKDTRGAPPTILIGPLSITGNLISMGINCGKSLTTLAYGRFNAIFFGNFINTEAHEIIGSLAVGGYFSGHAYTINTQHGANCSDLSSSFAAYALIVGKSSMNYTYSGVHVHGAAFLPDDANTDSIQQLDGACPSQND